MTSIGHLTQVLPQVGNITANPPRVNNFHDQNQQPPAAAPNVDLAAGLKALIGVLVSVIAEKIKTELPAAAPGGHPIAIPEPIPNGMDPNNPGLSVKPDDPHAFPDALPDPAPPSDISIPSPVLGDIAAIANPIGILTGPHGSINGEGSRAKQHVDNALATVLENVTGKNDDRAHENREEDHGRESDARDTAIKVATKTAKILGNNLKKD